MNNVVKGQSFIFKQLFRPSSRLETEWHARQAQQAAYSRIQLHTLIPIHSQLGLKLNWNKLQKKQNSWLKRIQRVPRVKAHQLFLDVRVQAQEGLGVPTHWASGLSLGLTGVHLGIHPKPHLWIYSAQIQAQEEWSHKTTPKLGYTALLARVQLHNLRRFYFYGIYLTGQGLQYPWPIPFLGFQMSLHRRWTAQITLPVQIRLSYTPHRRWNIDALASLSSRNSGMYAPNTSSNYDYIQYLLLRTGLQINYSKAKWRIALEAGYIPYRHTQGNVLDLHRLPATPYAACSIYYEWSRALLSERVMNSLSF